MIQQMTEWRERSHEVRLFLLAREEVAQDWISYAHYVSSSRGAYDLFAASRVLAKRSAEFSPDVIYLRYGYPLPAWIRAAQAGAMVIEVNSDDTQEYRLTTKAPQILFNKLLRRKLLSAAAGAVFVTNELGASPNFPLPARRVVIGNGIRLSDYDVVASHAGQVPTLVLLASDLTQPWIGLDKVLRLAERQPDWQFHIIGKTNATSQLANCTFHGELTRERYLPLLQKSDVGLDVLALHRKGLHEASALKTREYLAVGLPVIAGHADPDLPDGTPFVLRLPNSEENVSVSDEAISAFLTLWKGRRVPRDQVMHLDIGRKEEQRLTFMKRVVGEWRPA
jgi:glycosyltransferase involved in cell wall biosynthesis